MNNKKSKRFFNYIEKHPGANTAEGVVTIVGMIWVVYVAIGSLSMMDTFGVITLFPPVIAYGIVCGIEAILEHLFKEVFRGELVTDYFTVKFDDDGFQVTVDDEYIDETVITKKKSIPYFIRQDLAKASWVIMYKLPDENTIYICALGEKSVIYLNSTIIMENDTIYYDKIDKVYGVKTSIPMVETPVVENILVTAPIVPVANNRYALVALEGQFQGTSWEFSNGVLLGRDINCCKIAFAANAAGISRVHCEVGCKDGSLYIKDMGSSYGTTLENGQVVNNYQEVKFENNTTFRVSANEKFMIIKK